MKNEDPSQANKENEHVKLTMFEGKFVKLERSLPPLESLLESYGMYELYCFKLIITFYAVKDFVADDILT